MFGVARIKFFAKSGARLYLPNKLITHDDFPFKDGDIVKMEIGKNNIMVVSRPAWFELINWDDPQMKRGFEELPENIKEKIRGTNI